MELIIVCRLLPILLIVAWFHPLNVLVSKPWRTCKYIRLMLNGRLRLHVDYPRLHNRRN